MGEFIQIVSLIYRWLSGEPSNMGFREKLCFRHILGNNDINLYPLKCHYPLGVIYRDFDLELV